MLGSVYDAEDALQEALLRAWRGLGRVRGPQLAALVAVHDRDEHLAQPHRAAAQAGAAHRLRPGHGPPRGPGRALVESVWVEPYPDEAVGLQDGLAGPEARYELRESVELAFVAALQHLPGNQRAVLILREVLGFSADEVAEALDTSVASVNSALQRARKAVDERAARAQPAGDAARARRRRPPRARRGVRRGLGARRRRRRGRRCWPRTRPSPCRLWPRWFGGREPIREFLAGWPMSGAWRWRGRITQANGQPALGFYAWDDDAQHAPAVRAQRADASAASEISDVVAFVARSTEPTEREAYERWPEQPADPARLMARSSASACPSGWTDADQRRYRRRTPAAGRRRSARARPHA